MFAAEDVEESARRRLEENPCPPDHIEGESEDDRDMRLGAPYLGKAGHDESVILNWISGRSDDVSSVMAVPTISRRFEKVASDLILRGRGRVMCIKCGNEVPKGAPIYSQLNSRSWCIDEFKCERGHSLLEIEVIHLFRG